MAYGARKRPSDGIHKAIPGDTISSIAASYGITDWEAKVWDAGENAELKTQRVNPNTLVPKDAVFIPELTKKEESRPVDAWHEFHVVRNKRFIRLKLQNSDNTPVKNKTYKIEPAETFRGVFVQQGTTTGEEGKIEEEIPHTMIEADLVLPDDNVRIRLKIGHLLPLPMGDPVSGPSLDVEGALGALGDAAAGALGSAGASLSGAASALGGVAAGVAGSVSGAASGGLSLGSGGASASGSGGGGLGGAVSGIAGAAGQVQAIGTGAARDLVSSASAFAGAAASAVNNALGGLVPGDEDPNIYSAAQRLKSMGFKPGDPVDNKRTAAFTGALMEFQTWCKEQGNLADSAGGPLGELTAPGGVLGGGGGPLGAIAAGVAGPMLAAVGLTGQLDEATIEALKKTHGC
ncbi:MAG: hypothetical protein AMXMBFR47_27470 [Planctomycetota bacterium]